MRNLSIIAALIAAALVCGGCRYGVPAAIRDAQATVAQDQSITLGETFGELQRLGIGEPDSPAAAASAGPVLEDFDAEQLRRIVAVYRRGWLALYRCERNNWIVLSWMRGQDVRAEPKARPKGGEQ